jgi:hypothetical protein
LKARPDCPVCPSATTSVVFDAERISAEHERVLAVVEGIEQDLNRVGVVEAGVAPALADDNAVRRGVETDRRDVEVLAIEEKADLGPFGSRLAVIRFLLNESAERRDGGPDGIVDAAVDSRGSPRLFW